MNSIDNIYNKTILTDMKKLLITFEDDTANLLKQYPNMSQIVRDATNLYIGHILPDTVDGLRTSYKIIGKMLKEIDSKVDYIAGRVQ